MTALDAGAARAAYDGLVEEAKRAYDALVGDAATSVLVGTATCGRSAGALPVRDAFREELAAIGVDAPVVEVGCLGHCYAEPLAVVKRPGYPSMVYHHLTPATARVLVRKFFLEEDPYLDVFLGAGQANDAFPALADLPRFGREHRRLLARCGWIDPADVKHFLATGGYAGLVRALAMTPDEVIGAVRASGLRGLGGAGFPAWRKWEACRAHDAGPCGTAAPGCAGSSENGKGARPGAAVPHEKYLICNADEGDPGAFMDRTLLESDPHAVLEGMLAAARAIGAERGYVYVRAEYPLAVARARKAIADARAIGVLGESVLGSGMRFDVAVFEGAGAFVCGESSALMLSIEGKRGTPRVRPPQSTEAGLFGKPTVLNNVKTLASVGPILRDGPAAFAAVGTERSKGTAVFALAGKIAGPGLVEVPMGTTLRALLFEIGGGVPRGKRFKAVQIGGPSGGCLPESMLDAPIDFDALARAGSMMGSGGMVVLDQDNCVVDAARYFLEFTQRESCGKCTFCRIGTRHLLDLLTKIT